MDGLIHIYCGDGKGKTTAAVGLGVRAAGCGMKVLMLQFLKNPISSEFIALKNIPEITVVNCNLNSKFTFQMNKDELKALCKANNEMLNDAIKSIDDGKYDMLILDEVLDAYNIEVIDKNALEEFIKNKPKSLELVLTGRNPSETMKECADYISFIEKKKHPFDKGISARKGIEL